MFINLSLLHWDSKFHWHIMCVFIVILKMTFLYATFNFQHLEKYSGPEFWLVLPQK